MKNKKNTGKIILVSLLTILCTGVVASGLAYAGACIKNGSEKTNETIKGWFDKEETDKSSEEDKTSEENKDSTSSDIEEDLSSDSSEEIISEPEEVAPTSYTITKSSLENSIYKGLVSFSGFQYHIFEITDGIAIACNPSGTNSTKEIGSSTLSEVLTKGIYTTNNSGSRGYCSLLIDRSIFDIGDCDDYFSGYAQSYSEVESVRSLLDYDIISNLTYSYTSLASSFLYFVDITFNYI